MSAPRLSPLHFALAEHAPRLATRFGMNVAAAIPGEEAALATIALADASCLPRLGLKGAGADAWLRERGVSPAAGANRWAPLPDGGLVLRLGFTEFLLEGGPAPALAEALGAGVPGVTRVPRWDAALLLRGPCLPELLAQVCALDFGAAPLAERPLYMTSMAGVGVTVIPGLRDGLPFHRLWCDGTWAPGLWEALLPVARDLGGGPAGLAAAAPELFGFNGEAA